MPSWLAAAYGAALEQLADLGLRELRDAASPELIVGIIAILSFGKGLRSLGRLAVASSEDERREILDQTGYG